MSHSRASGAVAFSEGGTNKKSRDIHVPGSLLKEI